MSKERTKLGTHVTLAHGNGGRLMRELIDGIFARELGNQLDTHIDAARLPLEVPGSDWLITTDGFTVEPLEFPGGDIGSLAVHGTVNDLAVSGATPRYLSLNVFIEEGLEMAVLERISRSIGRACETCGVRILAGDTKVVRRGQGGGLYLATTGIGQRRREIELGMGRIQPGDRLIVSGTVGDHGTAVMLAREQFGLSGNLLSDASSVVPVTESLARLLWTAVHARSHPRRVSHRGPRHRFGHGGHGTPIRSTRCRSATRCVVSVKFSAMTRTIWPRKVGSWPH